MSGSTRLSGKYGYTLLELMAVLAIFAIFLSIAYPSINSLLHIKERRELMDFKRDLNYARSSAITEKTTYSITIDREQNMYIVTKAGSTSYLKLVRFENGLVFGYNNFSDQIDFTLTGAPSKGGTISLKNSRGQALRVTITPATGKVNIYYDN